MKRATVRFGVAAVTVFSTALVGGVASAATQPYPNAVQPASELGINAKGVSVDTSVVDVKTLDAQERHALGSLAQHVEQQGGGVILGVDSVEYVPEQTGIATAAAKLPGGCHLETGSYHSPNSRNYSQLIGWATNHCDGAFSHKLDIDIRKKKAGAPGSGTSVAGKTKFDDDVEVSYTCKTGYVAEYNAVSEGRVTIAGKRYFANGAAGWRRFPCGG